MVHNKQDARISIKIRMPFVWIIISIAHKISPEVKLIRPLDFQLYVSATVLFYASIPFVFQRQRVSFGSQLHMTVILVLRIKQHVFGLAKSIKLIKSQLQVSKRQRVSFYAYTVNPFSDNTGN